MVKSLFVTLIFMPSKTAHNKGWKQVQSNKQAGKQTKLALIVIGIMVGLLILSQLIKLTQMFFNPWKQSTTIKRTYTWNGNYNINIVLKGKDLALLSYDPKNEKATIVDIPPVTYLEAASGFGKWQLDSIYGLGETQKNIGGYYLLKNTLVSFFGLPIDGYIDFSGQYSQMENFKIVSEFRKNIFSTILLLPFIKTDLTPFELIRLKIGLSAIRFDKIKRIDLQTNNSLLPDKLLDGSDILTPDPIKIDSSISDLADPIIQSERLTIAIFNSTDHPQLAQRAARLITNIGGDVIITTNSDNKTPKSYVAGKESKTLTRLKQIFEPGGDIILKSNEDLVLSRAQINVFLGNDYFDRL